MARTIGWKMSYPSKETLERVDLTLKILTPVSIAIVLAALVMNYQSIGNKVGKALHDAGFQIKEANFFGFTMEVIRNAQGQTDELGPIRANLEKAGRDYAELKTLLTCQKAATCSEAQTVRIDAVLRSSPGAPVIGDAIKAVDRVISDNERAVREAVQSLPPASLAAAAQASAASPWIVVVGADKTLPETAAEARKIAGAAPKTRVLLRDGWYRTVAEFPTEAEARAKADDIGKLVGRTPYVRALAAWCANPKTETGFTRCEG